MDIKGQKDTVVAKLRVQGTGLDSVATRLHIERLFSATDFLPSCLPPNAVVCIKKIRDPQPRTLQLNQAALCFSDAWRNMVSREIENFYRRASRPISETVPAQAESVVFAEYAELLACLATDWLRGMLIHNWWWKSLFRNLDDAKSIARVWIESAEYVPGAIQLLEKKKLAVEFVSNLHAVEIEDLVVSIAEVYDLHKLKEVFLLPVTKQETDNYRRQFAEDKIASKRGQKTKDPPKPDLFSKLFADSSTITLSFERKTLIFLALTLVRSPRIANSAEFAEGIRQIKIESEIPRNALIPRSPNFSNEKSEIEISGKKSEIHLPPKQLIKSDGLRFTKDIDVVKPTTTDKKAALVESEGTEPERNVEPKKISEPKIEMIPENRSEARLTNFRFEEPKTDDLSTVKIGKGKTRDRLLPNEVIEEVTQVNIEEEIDQKSFDSIIHTEFGGIFYLLNFGLYLNLYQDFSSSLTIKFDLGIWDFVAILSHDFLGDQIFDDPVWQVLNQLSGREIHESIVPEFSGANEWKMTAEWMKTFGDAAAFYWAKTKTRLVIRHSEGFNAIDIPLENDVDAQLAREIENFGLDALRIVELEHESFYEAMSPAESWMKNFSEFAERRLIQALNLESRGQIIDVLLKRRATVAVSQTHLEAIFNLADLPIEVRFSGLDRNPGWIAAAGKYVEFRFA